MDISLVKKLFHVGTFPWIKKLTIFGGILARDLRTMQLNRRSLLQYVDYLLITSLTYEVSLENTIQVLNHLTECGSMLSSLRHKFVRNKLST
jgi:hypothetical protein